MTETVAPLPPRNWTLDILRGACALTVFLNHWILWSDFAPTGAIQLGLHRVFIALSEGFTALAWPTGGVVPAVLCFFVLGGYCGPGPFERRLHEPAAPAPRW